MYSFGPILGLKGISPVAWTHTTGHGFYQKKHHCVIQGESILATQAPFASYRVDHVVAVTGSIDFGQMS